MTYKFITTLGLTIAMIAGLSSTPATAAVRKDVSEFAGQRCNTPARGSGVIVGIFDGVGSSLFNSDGDALRSVSRYRCFSSEAECKGWLYTMRSKYDAGIPRTAKCLKR